MYLSRIIINNFRNFSMLDVRLAGNVVVAGENRIGKSNFIYALRLIFDPTLPDSARQLNISDFWDGLDEIAEGTTLSVSVEIKDFENDLNVLALLTDFRVDDDPETVRLSYEFSPKVGLGRPPASEDDFEFACYGGGNKSTRFGHELRRRLTMDLLPALRDAEGDLGNWSRSPLRPLIESAFRQVSAEDLESVKAAIEAATQELRAFETVDELEESIRVLFEAMSGPRQNIEPRLGLGSTDVSKLIRNIKLLIDDGRRGISDASLGSANVVFLTLKTLEIKRLMGENKRDHTLLAIEEPEAHLHPHLQRSVYRHLFEEIGDGRQQSLSVFLTTHSPHVASIAPLRSLLLLKDAGESGTVGSSTADIELSEDEVSDLTRYLDVTRAEMLFARGVILVEGDSERFLLPVFAKTIGQPLDKIGVTVCSVGGTNFKPYAKFLAALGIPFSIVTDWDPMASGKALGINRAAELVGAIERAKTGENAVALTKELKTIGEKTLLEEFDERCAAYGVFTNSHTLEVDLFRFNMASEIIQTLRENEFSAERQGWIASWEADPEKLDVDNYLKLIEAIGKGRVAQRLSSYAEGLEPPRYLQDAIIFVTDRV